MIEHCKSIHEKQDKSIDLINSQCMVCGKILKKTHLKHHRMMHNKDRLFECRLCYSKFKTKSTLKSHKRTVHRSAEERQLLKANSVPDPMHACDTCEYKFYTKSLLKQHLTKQHYYNSKNKQDSRNQLQFFECIS